MAGTPPGHLSRSSLRLSHMIIVAVDLYRVKFPPASYPELSSPDETRRSPMPS